MSSSPLPTPVAAFCAFAQPDQPFCLQLEQALKPAQRQGVLTLWHEGRILSGTDRTEAIESHLISDTLILLLISPDFLASAQTLSIHRLVQAVLEDTTDESTRTLWTERAVRAVDAAFPFVEFASWPQCERLLPQALECAKHIEHRRMIFPQAARLLNQTACYLHDQSRYAQAEPLYEQALATKRKLLGSEHPDTALSLNNLATLYYDQGKYEQAKPLLWRALAVCEQRLGPKHQDTCTVQGNYDALLQAMGKKEGKE